MNNPVNLIKCVPLIIYSQSSSLDLIPLINFSTTNTGQFFTSHCHRFILISPEEKQLNLFFLWFSNASWTLDEKYSQFGPSNHCAQNFCWSNIAYKSKIHHELNNFSFTWNASFLASTVDWCPRVVFNDVTAPDSCGLVGLSPSTSWSIGTPIQTRWPLSIKGTYSLSSRGSPACFRRMRALVFKRLGSTPV